MNKKLACPLVKDLVQRFEWVRTSLSFRWVFEFLEGMPLRTHRDYEKVVLRPETLVWTKLYRYEAHKNHLPIDFLLLFYYEGHNLNAILPKTGRFCTFGFISSRSLQIRTLDSPWKHFRVAAITPRARILQRRNQSEYSTFRKRVCTFLCWRYWGWNRTPNLWPIATSRRWVNASLCRL